MINNTLIAFNEDVKKLSHILKMNQFHEHLINKVIYNEKNSAKLL